MQLSFVHPLEYSIVYMKHDSCVYFTVNGNRSVSNFDNYKKCYCEHSRMYVLVNILINFHCDIIKWKCWNFESIYFQLLDISMLSNNVMLVNDRLILTQNKKKNNFLNWI